jgi:tetratricopeptide (TPR) repeat protein
LALSTVSVYRGQYGKAAATTERLREIAKKTGDPLIAVMAERRLGIALITIGRPAEAQRCFERVIGSSVLLDRERLPIWRQSGDRAIARAMLARALWLQGFLERANNEAQASLDELQSVDHQLTICRVLYYGICRIATMTGDFVAAERSIARLIEAARSLNARFWTTAGQFLQGKLMVARGEFAEGLVVLRAAFTTCNETGWRLSYPEFSGSLALALAGLGRLDEADDAVTKAIAAAGRREDGQQWYVPELLRIKGEVLLRWDASPTAAADCFSEAAEMAREQGALFWELRIALSLARWLVAEDQADAASKVLIPVYRRFREGFDTADMLAAKALLDALPPNHLAAGP